MAEEKAECNGRKTPCKECPFSRTGKPKKGQGAAADRLIGQAIGPFYLPCHMAPGYKQGQTDFGMLQCAGAAIYRANVGVTEIMPPGLHALPADPEKVYATPRELKVGVDEVSPLEAALHLLAYPPVILLQIELAKQGVVRKPKGADAEK